jgi:hypothetical protein
MSSEEMLFFAIMKPGVQRLKVARLEALEKLLLRLELNLPAFLLVLTQPRAGTLE